MRSFLPRVLLLLLPLMSLSASSQEPAIARIAVAPLRVGGVKISVTGVRDRLVKALNQQKPDKKTHIGAQAVPIEASEERAALAEAREKNCDFLLIARLTDVQTSEKLDVAAFGGQGGYVPVVSTNIAYELRRVADGVEYAVGTAKSDESSSIDEAVMRTTGKLAQQVATQLREGGNAPHPAVAESAPPTVATSGGVEVSFFNTDFCKWLPTNVPHAEALRGVCEYAISLPQRMPNFICEQETGRYRGNNSVPRDLISAVVRYEDGNETYSEIKVNGKPAPNAVSESVGLWSTGEFGSNLRDIFDYRNNALFEFRGESQLDGRSVWLFEYRIVRQNDPLWRLRAADRVLAPPYAGELWVDAKTGGLLRFRAAARDIPADFPMQAAELNTDYNDVNFGDGTAFLLPVKSSVLTQMRGEEATRNMLEFRNCHKFRAKSRMLFDLPAGTAVTGLTPDSDGAERERDRQKSEDIYAILREQAVREDSARLQLEQRDILSQNQSEAFSKWAGLEKERQKVVAQELASSENEAKSSGGPVLNGPLMTIKADVHLVPVSVVLRDAMGKTVGDRQKDDFRLSDEGKAQAITSFSVERPNSQPVADRVAVSPESPGPRSPIEVADRFVAYVFDDIHSAAADLSFVRDSAIRVLDRLQPGDRVAIFTTSAQIATDFSSDREKLQEALKGLRPHPALPVSTCPRLTPYMADLIANHDDPDALSVAIQDGVQCAAGGMANSAAEMERIVRLAKTASYEVLNATSAENQGTLNSLRQVLRRIAGQAGRRSVVFISPGFLSLQPEVRFGLTEMFDGAVRAGIVINTMDLRGLVTTGVSGDRTNLGTPESLQLLRDEASAQNDTMAEIADGTGGIFFHNSNDMDEGFSRTADAPEFIYILGFSPQKLDGKFHKLKVALVAKNGPKLSVQARRGYYASKPEIHH